MTPEQFAQLKKECEDCEIVDPEQVLECIKEIERLLKIAEYADHKRSCPKQVQPFLKNNLCDCGLDEVIK
jgi:hypothetical protein